MTTTVGRESATDRQPAFPDGLPLVRPTIDDPAALAADLAAVLASGILTNGARVRELEATVAARLDVRHVVAVSSCTAGLMLVWQALRARGPVVLPSFTFSASAHAVAWAGGTPRFTEVRPDNLTLDVEAAAARMDGAVGLCATHVYGTPCDVEGLTALAATTGVPLVFDAAHALGSEHAGRPVGGFGAAEVFSLSPTKVVVGGEGGLVATNRDDIAEAVRLGRDYGNPGDYDCRFAGLNARMSELHAVTALHSLRHLDAHLEQRRKLARVFRHACAGLPGIRYPQLAAGDTSTLKDLTLIVDADEFGMDAAALAARLRLDGIDSRHYYRPPIHRQQAYAGLTPVDLPGTDRLAGQVLSLPLWSHMTADVVQRMADAVVAARSVADERT